jgi:adenosylcobinamide amidohydrolase
MNGVSAGATPHNRTEAFEYRIVRDTLAVSFFRPIPVMSWAILNGGFRSQTAHISNHRVEAGSPNGSPGETLRKLAGHLRLKDTVVGMMTAADVRSYSIAKASHGDLCAHALTTAGCSNLATVGEEGRFVEGESQPTCAGTINLIVMINYRFTQEAMLEALAIATEAKVRAVYESGLRSMVPPGRGPIAWQ